MKEVTDWSDAGEKLLKLHEIYTKCANHIRHMEKHRWLYEGSLFFQRNGYAGASRQMAREVIDMLQKEEGRHDEN